MGDETHRWKNVYSEQYYGTNTQIQTSDANKKNTISDIDEKYSDLFNLLRPVTFKLNDGTSGRFHMGLIANELKEAIETAGLTTQEVAAYCSWTENGEETCGIRYGEFVPLNIHEIQKLKTKVREIEEEIRELKGEK